MAKFLSFDIPLFVGITSDLFPSITSPQINYEHLLVEIASEY
jgi:dynein heavy chain